MDNLLTIPAATMSSREIADLTDKAHRNVTRDIGKMLTDLNEDLLKFEHIYSDSHGRQQKEYQLPKNLTLNLITGYRSDIRLKVVDRWIELEGDYASMSECEQMLWHAQRLVDQERRVKAIEIQQAQDHASLTALVSGEDFFTVVGFANINDARLDRKATSKIGKIATSTCNDHGWSLGSAPHPMFGKVNTYPREALEMAFSTYAKRVEEGND